MKRLHITGCPRSGTTLLMELMSTCYESDSFCEHEMSIFKAFEVEGELVISKKPTDIRRIQRIFFRDPNLFVIYLVRDPRSVISSMHHSKQNEYRCNYRIWKLCENAAEKYRGHRRFLSLRYEDLATDPDALQLVIEKQFSFLRRKYKFSEFHQFAKPSETSAKTMNGLRPVSTGRIASWKAHLPRIKEQTNRRKTMAADLVRLGYENNDDWLELLQDVAPRKFACRHPEYPQLLKELDTAFRVWRKSRKYLAGL